ncbi:hypothetical protein GCM10009565_86410 [Amycolatopsis albidoflavus]
MRGSFTESDSLKEPFTAHPARSLARPPARSLVRSLAAAMRPNATLGASHAPNATFGASHAPNAAFGAPHAPNVAFGASHAPNATLGRKPRLTHQTAADAPNRQSTHPAPNPDTKPPLRFGGDCQGIFPALTITPEPSAQ